MWVLKSISFNEREMDIADNLKGKKSGQGITVAALIIAAFMLYYAIMSALAPHSRMKELENEIRTSLSALRQYDERYEGDSLYLSLMKKKSFLQSRILMAGNDSISLTIDLADSLAYLEIAGVVVKTTGMTDIKMSRILRTGNEFIITSMLSSPLNIINYKATIKKEPLMIKMAPKDTSEYKPDIMPDTSAYEAVSYILETDKGINIYVTQAEKAKKGFRKQLFWFDLKCRLTNTWASMKSVIKFKIPEYKPFIKISLPRTDAKVIYRAIPMKGQITVNL